MGGGPGAAGGAAQAEVRDRLLESTAVSADLYAALLWIAATLFFAVATAMASSVTTAFYYDCRVRRGALDLFTRLESIAAPRTGGVRA